MTIHVEKLIERSWPNASSVASDAGKESMYSIELSVVELEYLRCALANYVANTKHTVNNQNSLSFADKCATIINNALVSNGE